MLKFLYQIPFLRRLYFDKLGLWWIRRKVAPFVEYLPKEAKIIDIGPDVAIIEMSGTEDFVEKFVNELRPFEIVEMVRTGLVSMGRGTRIQDTDYQPVKVKTVTTHKTTV